MALVIDALEPLETEFRHPVKSRGHSSELALKVFGNTYYQLHGTVMENTVPVVLDHLKARVSSNRFNDLPPCLSFSRILILSPSFV
jgi:hypothetical protein